MDEPAETLPSGPAELRRWRTGDLDALDHAISESLDHLLPWMAQVVSSHERRPPGGRAPRLPQLALGGAPWCGASQGGGSSS
ncbi:hypothetical protein ACFZAU_39955 [Streptomyces sp. NPDC008238]